MRHPVTVRSLVGVLCLATLALASCVDAPSAPEGSGTPDAPFAIAPVFSLVGPGGAVVSGPQASALSEAFDRVDRFRMVVTRVPSNVVALDTVITVTPGQPEYDLSVDVAISGASEQFTVTLTALEGDVELFTSEPISVTVTPTPAGSSAPPPTSTNVTLRYSGPGSTATALVLTPAQAVLAPGGTVQLAAQVLDQGGQPIAGVTLAWTTATAAVATVTNTGLATAAGDGKAQITVATPGGLEAKAWIYVLGGELAYVEGGELKVRAPAGGTATVRASGASMPAYTADGSKLYYSTGDQVRLAGGGTLGAGTWPAPSPDGTKLVVDGVTFFNDDGSNPTPGPSGSTPLWLDDATLLVAGGSLQSVRADGTGRTTIVAGAATGPALSGSSLAYISDGALKIQGRTEPLLTGASGRPSWSADGAWLVVSAGSGLTLVPSDGGAPPVALPGLGSASQPAFRPTGSLSTPPTPTVTGFGPTAPKPGEVVTLVGTGFDWIIPANTKVIWPVAGGSVEGVVQKVTATQIDVLMPASVIAGQVRVATRAGTGVLAYTPSTSTLNVSARTPWDAPVAGMVVVVANATGTVLGQATTDAAGAALIAGIAPGQVTVSITPPTGYKLDGEATRSLDLPTGPSSLALVATPQVKSVKLTPEKPVLGISDEVGVTVVPLDANGVPIPEIKSIAWASASPKLDVWESDGLSTTIVGRQPSVTAEDAGFSVTLDGQVFNFAATVTSAIRGTVTQDPAPVGAPSGAPAHTPDSDEEPAPTAAPTEPAPGITVNVLLGEKQVGTATTSKDGTYVVSGLLAGTYEVTPVPNGDYSSVPNAQSVTLDAAHPTGTADFHMSLGVADRLEVSASETPLHSLGDFSLVTFLAYDVDDNLLGARPATYASTNEAVLTVGADGKATAVGNGSAYIRVTVDGVKDSVLVTVDQQAVSLQLFKEVEEPAPDSTRFLVQEEFQILYEARDANGNLIPASHRKPIYTPNTGKLAIDVDGNAVASASDVGREVLIVSMDAASDTLVVWVLGVRSGDFDANTDMAVMADSLYGQIQGTLWIDATGLTDLDGLATIFEVWGDVNVRDNPSLTDVSGLRNIEEVGGTLRIKRNAVLATPAVPPGALKYIHGNLKIWDNPQITAMDAFGNLVWVGGYVDIIGNPSLTDVSGFSSLESANGLSLESNAVLSVPNGFPSLQWLGWDGLYIDEGATIARFPSLQGIEGTLTVGGVASPINPIESLNLPSLQCVEDVVWIYDNESLTEAKFPVLDRVGDCATPFDELEVAPPAPVSGAFRSAPSARAAFGLRTDPDARDPRSVEARKARLATKLTSARVARDDRRARAAAERETARTQSRAELVASELGGAQRVAVQTQGRQRTPPRQRPQRTSGPMKYYEGYGGLVVEYNPSLTLLDLAALQGLDGDLSLEGNGLGTLTIPLLETIGGDLSLYSSNLSTLTVPSLVSVSDDIWIEYNEFFEQLVAPLLESVGDDFYVQYNDALGDWTLPSLRSIGYTIEFYGNTWNSYLKLPKLEDVYSDVYIEYNTGLTSVEIATESFLAVGYYFEIDDNDGLESINVPGADYLYYLYISDNADLVSVDMATTATLDVDYDFEINYNPALETITIPGLASAYYLEIQNNDGLTAVDLATTTDLAIDWRGEISYNAVGHPWTLNIPGYLGTGSDLQIRYNDGLTTATVATGSPATIASTLDLSYNPDLTTFSAPSLVSAGHFIVNANPALTSMSVGSLTTVSGLLQVEQTGLANLDALSSVTSRVGDLIVFNNAALTSVTGLNGLGTAAGSDPIVTNWLNIQFNANLCQTDAEALHTLLEARYGGTAAATVTILNNKACVG